MIKVAGKKVSSSSHTCIRTSSLLRFTQHLYQTVRRLTGLCAFEVMLRHQLHGILELASIVLLGSPI